MLGKIGLAFFYPGSFCVGWMFIGKDDELGVEKLVYFDVLLGFFALRFIIGEEVDEIWKK